MSLLTDELRVRKFGAAQHSVLVARIRKDSKYAYQSQHHTEPFSVVIEADVAGYVVRGGFGGRYRLSDVHLYAHLEDGKLIELNCVHANEPPRYDD